MTDHHDMASVIEDFVRHSPFAQKLGLRIDSLEADRCELTLPFDESIATYGDVVHGGATATLVDVAATAAAWSSSSVNATAGATADLTVQFLRPARGQDLRAVARVSHRGRSLCAVDVEVHGAADDELVARALATHKFATEDSDPGHRDDHEQ